MFRITISDTFGHILSRLQKIVTDETKSNAAMLPKHIALEEVTKKVTPDLKRKTDSVYHEKELTVVVTFQVEENSDINLLGVTKRSWLFPSFYPGSFVQQLKLCYLVEVFFLLHFPLHGQVPSYLLFCS